MCGRMLSNDGEALACTAFRLPFAFDLGYLGGRWAMTEPCEELFERGAGALGQAFHGTVIAIANPSRKPEGYGLSLGAIAKTDPLDATTNDAV